VFHSMWNYSLIMRAMSCICNKYYDDEDERSSDIDDDRNNSKQRYYTSTDYKDYVIEQTIIDNMFPGAKFVVSIPLNEMNNVVSDLKQIIVKQTFDCYCYAGIPTRSQVDNDERRISSGDDGRVVPKWFPIHCRDNEKMTNKHIIQELIRQDMSLLCNHCFLEGFVKSPNGGECQFELALGS